MSQGRNRNHAATAAASRSRSRSKSRSRSRSRSRSGSLVSTASGRAAKARKWDGETGYRVHVSPLNPRTTRRDIERIFSKFGPLNEVWMATNPPCFAFVNFRHRADSDDAIHEYDGKTIDGSRVGLSFARKRTIGGRRGGGGGGGHFNGGGGGDRYSRDYDSRSRRRYSPRQNDDRRRRYSRSRSPVQHGKRDYSPRSRSRSRSPTPKARRSRQSPRERSPQQQAVNVQRYDDNED